MHSQVVTQAALAEFRSGSPERGRSILEGILRNYPKRLDLWSVYLDQARHALLPFDSELQPLAVGACELPWSAPFGLRSTQAPV